MSVYADNRIINLNSSDSTQLNGTYLSNVNFNLSGILKDDTDIAYSTIGCINALLPVSWYTINYTNNILSILIDGTPYTVTLTKGNYTATTLITEIINEFTLLFTSLSSSNAVNVVLNQPTGILTFLFKTTTSVIQFSYLNSQGLFSVLGLGTTTNYISSGGVLICPYPLNLLGITKLKICSNLLSTYSFDSSQTYNGQIIQTIPVNASSWGLVNFLNQSAAYGKIRSRNIDTIDIQLLDQNNNFINFNNIGWTITLVLTIYRKFQFEGSVLNLTPLTVRLDKIDEDLHDLGNPQESAATGKEQPEGVEFTPDNDLATLLYNSPNL